MEFKDYYKTLGVEKTATAEDIKKAFRKLARKYHPDLSKEPDAQAKMSELNEANTVLSDVEKRAAYDQLSARRAAGSRGGGGGDNFQPPPNWDQGFEYRGAPHGGEEFSDFFANLFGQAGQAARARATPGRSEPQTGGEDHHAKIVIALRDSYEGANRDIGLRAPRLDAAGRVALQERTLQVRIPKGVREGQQIRLTGQGSPGYGGAPAGDLYLEIGFEADPRFRIDGRDVTQTLPVAPWEAALGADIDIPTPSGSVKVTVPANSRGGRKLRLRGRGIPGEPPGDLYLEMELVLPPPSDKSRALFQTMASELAFDPRAGMGD